eukprot:c26543_g1_i1.p1 GENE.c26543_g1_i1~~c26543_g1_i1.p1  ORF type:complete len:234 (-),score=52.62 c26543_g1_i1:381-1082(-)
MTALRNKPKTLKDLPEMLDDLEDVYENNSSLDLDNRNCIDSCNDDDLEDYFYAADSDELVSTIIDAQINFNNFKPSDNNQNTTNNLRTALNFHHLLNQNWEDEFGEFDCDLEPSFCSIDPEPFSHPNIKNNMRPTSISKFPSIASSVESSVSHDLHSFDHSTSSFNDLVGSPDSDKSFSPQLSSLLRAKRFSKECTNTGTSTVTGTRGCRAMSLTPSAPRRHLIRCGAMMSPW